MKKINVFLLLGVLLTSSLYLGANAVAQDDVEVLIYGNIGTSMVDTIDLHDAWDSASIDVLDQVLEGLFAYNLTDPDLGIINRLATDFEWTPDNLNLTVTLREGVTFHDGTTFGPEDVVFSFDRLMGLIDQHLVQVAELYEPLNGVPVINETVATGAMEVTFVLNYVYSAFIPLLCFSASYIIPENGAPLDDLLDYGGGDQVIGTGPFLYDADNTFDSTELDFVSYADYWGGEADIKKMIWVLYSDTNVVNQAFLNGDVHLPAAALPEFYDQFEADPNIVLGEVRSNLVVTYLGLSCINLDVVERKAISYAIDYDYLIDEVMLGYARRLKSPVPQGIVNAIEADAAVLNKTYARQLLIDNGYVDTTYFTEEYFGFTPAEIAGGWNLNASSPDDMWEDIAAWEPIMSYNYTYNVGSSTRFDLGLAIQDDLGKIGVEMSLSGVSWSQFLRKAFVSNQELELYLLGWAPDYNDASNYINPLFSNTSSSNGPGLNDPQVQQWMMDALATTDPAERTAIYADIQHRLVEELFPWAFLFTGAGRGAWSIAIQGIQRNAMGKLYFYPMDFDLSRIQETGGGGFIPGFGIVTLIGVSAIALLASAKKFKK
jgi:ABC-type transport system substrate-binding protein